MSAILDEKKTVELIDDYFYNSKIEELDEDTKKNELIEIAKKRGILFDDTVFDIAILKSVYSFSDTQNGNKEIFPKKDWLRALPYGIGKPITIDHVDTWTVGYILDFKYIIKEDKIIVYFLLWKHVFQDEWDKAIELFNKGKLKFSHEVWEWDEYNKKLSNGVSEKHNFQSCGGAILFSTKPAFGNKAEVLDVVATYMQKYSDIRKAVSSYYSSPNNKLTASIMPKNKTKFPTRKIVASIVKEIQEETTQTQQPTFFEVICNHCQNSFKHQFNAESMDGINCPNCKCVVDKSGKVLHPPQLLNFDLTCENCESRNNWLTLEENENTAKIKCKGCQSQYDLKFQEKSESFQFIKKFIMEVSGKVSCPQCGHKIAFVEPSNLKIVNKKCDVCKMKFNFELPGAKTKKQIESFSKVENKGGKTIEDVILELDNDNLDILKNIDKNVSSELSYQEEKQLPDSAFAVNVNVKNKDESQKIRKYPIKGTTDDKTRVRAALRYLGMPRNTKELRKIGISSKAVIRKVLKRAKELNMTDLLERRKEISKIREDNKKMDKKLLRKAVKKIRAMKSKASAGGEKITKAIILLKKSGKRTKSLKRENLELQKNIASINTSIEDNKKFYMVNAKKIVARVNELGEFAKDLSDEQILDDNIFEVAKAKKIIASADFTKAEKAQANAVKNVASENVVVTEEIAEADEDAKIDAMAKEIHKNAFKDYNLFGEDE